MRIVKGRLGTIWVVKKNKKKDRIGPFVHVELDDNDVIIWGGPVEAVRHSRLSFGRYLAQTDLKPRGILITSMTKEALSMLWDRVVEDMGSKAKKDEWIFRWCLGLHSSQRVHEEWVDVVLP